MSRTGRRIVNLASLYERSAGPVAFVDETFQRIEGTRQPFYCLAAALLEPPEIDQTRKELVEFVRGDEWHTTAEFAAGHGTSVMRMIAVIRAQPVSNVLVISAPIVDVDEYCAAGREQCLSGLLVELEAWGVRVVVAESRGRPHLDAADTEVASALRGEGLLSRNTAFVHARQSDEPLLWVPDAVAWAYRQRLTRKSVDWFGPLADISHVVRLGPEMKQPPGSP